MAVLFKIISVAKYKDKTILAECIEKDKNFWVTPNMRLGEVKLESWFSVPRALDQNKQPRTDVFVFERKENGTTAKLNVGDVVPLMPADQLEFLLPWQQSLSNADAFEQELYRELRADHPLFGQVVEAIAVRVDCDDVLFKLQDDTYAAVHLTWSGKTEKSANVPYTRLYDHWTEVYEKVIFADFLEY